jgi:hypothetical protein
VTFFLKWNRNDIKFRVFWDVAPCSLGVDRRFRGANCLWNLGPLQRDYKAIHPRRLWTYIIAAVRTLNLTQTNIDWKLHVACRNEQKDNRTIQYLFHAVLSAERLTCGVRLLREFCDVTVIAFPSNSSTVESVRGQHSPAIIIAVANVSNRWTDDQDKKLFPGSEHC